METQDREPMTVHARCSSCPSAASRRCRGCDAPMCDTCASADDLCARCENVALRDAC